MSVTDTAIHQERKRSFGFAENRLARYKCQIGAHGARETPVPIPNTAVKPGSGYNTWV